MRYWLILIFHLLIVVGAWNSSPTARGVTFAWDTSSETPVSGYGLYYSTEFFTNPHDTDDFGLPLAQSHLVGNQLTASLPDLLPNTTYYLRVTAFGTNGVESDPSSIAVFNTSSPFPPRCSTNANGTVRVSWDARPDPAEPQRLAQFVLYYSSQRFDVSALDEGSSAMLHSLSIGRQTNAVLASLPMGEIYYFAVAAFNSNGVASDLSNVAELVIPPPPSPKCSVGDRGEVRVAWGSRPDRGKPGSVAGYYLYYSQQSFDLDSIALGSDSSLRVLNAGNQTNAVFANLALNQTYYFAVAVYDRKGIVTDLSSLTQFLTPSFNSKIDLRPLPPVFLSVAATGWDSANGTVTTSWGPSPDPVGVASIAGFILYYSTNFFDHVDNLSDLDDSQLQAVPFGNQTSAVLTGLSPGQTYYFAIAAYRPGFVKSELSNIAVTTTTLDAPPAVQPPAPPASLSVGTDEANVAGGVRVTWDPSPDAGISGKIIGYKVYYETLSGAITALTVDHHTSVVLTNLAPGGTYYFAITAYDNDGMQSTLSGPVTFTAPPELDLSAQLPGFDVSFSNSIPILTIHGSFGANIEVQSTLNPSGSGGWETVANLLLTQGAPVLTNADLLETAFFPATEVFVDEADPSGDAIKFYRVVMSDGYANIADRVLKPQGYNTRLIGVRLPDSSTHVVCYVSEANSYIDYNDQTHLAKLQPSGPKIREIATRVANSLNLSWISATEFQISGELRVVIATVTRTDPPESDPP